MNVKINDREKMDSGFQTNIIAITNDKVCNELNLDFKRVLLMTIEITRRTARVADIGKFNINK